MAAKRTRKLLVWVLFLHSSLVFSQITFQKTFGGFGNEAASWIIEALDGYVIAGNVTNSAGNQDALLVRLDGSGNIIWQKRFGAGQSDAFHCVVNTSDGYLAVGETRSLGSGNVDIFLVKVNAAGAVVWCKTVGEADRNDVALGLIPVSAGGYIVSGYSMTCSNASTNSIFLRLDQNGSTVWSRTYSTNSSNLLLSNYIDGNVIYASGSADGEAAFVRLELNSGSILSTKAYSGSGMEALYYQQPTADGNLLLADHISSTSTSSDAKVWIQNVNRTTGQVLWSKVYHRPNDNICGRIEKVNDGGFLLVPYSCNNTPQSDALLGKIDPSGNLLWAYNYGGNASDRLIKAVQTLDGGFIAVGDTRSSSGNGSSDILIVKTDANGLIQGNCAKDANLQAMNFTASNLSLTVTQVSWKQAAAVLMSPLSINLQTQTFMPNAVPVIFKTVALCPNTAFAIGGVPHFAPKMVADTLASLNGCDTVFMYNLTLSPYNTGIHVIGLCDGQTYTINGVQYSAPNTVLDTVPSLTGSCDTVYTYVLKVWAQPTAEQTITFCPGETVLIGGQIYAQPGIVKSTKPATTGGCDTLVTYTLVLRPQPARAVSISFCPGETVLIGGNTYSQAGTVISAIPASNGASCDTLVTYTLELKPQPSRAEKLVFCAGESVLIAGQSYHQSGLVVANLASSTGGCDTVVTYTLEQVPQPSRAEIRSLCPGQSVTIGGQLYNQAGSVVVILASTTGGCDTLVTYTLEIQTPPARVETRTFCPGQSVTIGGQSYTQPATVIANLPSTTGGCDTIVKYTLELLPQITRSETISFCPGESVIIAGQNYDQPGAVVANLPSNTGGCDTIVTYTLNLRPQASRSETYSFCPGESILIAGQAYTQPGTFVGNVASITGGCDTVVTYTLNYLTPAPSNIALKCPANITKMVGTGPRPVVVNYADPVAASDCICAGLELDRTNGPASESLFPVGITEVCYRAKDNCGQEKLCCFSVNIREEEACEVKVNGCIRYELLSITADSARNRTYRIRVTNNCANKLISTAIQIPDGLIAMEPANNSTYSSSENRNYLVRSPNFSPMYSIRFKSTSDSIFNGQSDVFEYTLPAQAEVEYISIVSRLTQQANNETYLTILNCPVGVTPSNRIVKTKSRDAEAAWEQQNSMLLFPNPTTGALFADLSDWQGKKVQIQITNAVGQLFHTIKLVANEDLLRIEMPQGATNGIYLMEVVPEDGKKEVMRFMVQR